MELRNTKGQLNREFDLNTFGVRTIVWNQHFQGPIIVRVILLKDQRL